MTPWFRTYRENVDDPQNSMMDEMFKLILQARTEQQGTSTSTDVERKRVQLLTSESYLIFISDGCFVIGKQRNLNLAYKWYLGREPDGVVCRCWLEFEYRSNTIHDKSLRGNNAILRGYPTIVAYQPEYPRSALHLNGTTSIVDMGTTSKLNQGITAGSEITYCFWYMITVNPVGATARVITRGNAAQLIPHIPTSGEIRCDFKYHDATTFTALSGITTKNVWHSVVCAHSDILDLSTFYVDGVLITSNVKNDYLRDSGAGVEDRFLLGALPTGASTQTNFFPDGYLDDVRVYDRALTATEALAYHLGTEISPLGLVSQWHFDEDEDVTKAFDSIGNNSGTMTTCTFEKTNIPAIFQGTKIPHRDGMIDKLIGYKTDGEEYLWIAELEDDFRITGKTTGGLWYRWEVKFSTFAVFNENWMRLLEKCDDEVPNYFQSYQIGPDGKFYCFGIFNGVQKKIRTVAPLKLLKRYDIIAGIDYNSIAGGVATSIFQVYINGYVATTEVTTEDADVPQTEHINTFGTHIATGTLVSRGALVGQIYSFRYYEEDITAAKALAIMTNRYTTYTIDRGHVLKSNMTKLPISLQYRFINFTVPLILLSEKMSATVTDLVLTGRFSNIASDIPISDDFDFFLADPPVSLGNYAIDLTNTSSIHSWVEMKTIDPVKDHFSFFAWVKYRGRVGDWGGIISAIDGLDNSNRLLMTATQIRYQGQFDKESNDYEDFRVTVPSMTGSYHLIGFTHDGDKKEFKIYLDGKLQKTFRAKGDIRGTDRSKTFLGKGSKNGYYLDGLIDDVVIYDKTISQKEVNKLWMKVPVEKGLMAHFMWERSLKDVEDGKFNCKSVGTVKFSTDHV